MHSDEEALVKLKCAVDFLRNDISVTELAKHKIAYGVLRNNESPRIAVIFSGQGTQRISMFEDMMIRDETVGGRIDEADRLMATLGEESISSLIYPHRIDDNELKQAEQKLLSPAFAQPVLAVIESALYEKCVSRGIDGHCFLGHSFGEVVALWADGQMDWEALIRISVLRGKCMSSINEPIRMLAVFSNIDQVRNVLPENIKCYITHVNSPMQTVVAVEEDKLRWLQGIFREKGILTRRLNLPFVSHCTVMEKTASFFSKALAGIEWRRHYCRVISNWTGKYYDSNKMKIENMLEMQMTNTIRFVDCVKAAYSDGAHIFLEIGCGNVLTTFVNDILKGEEFTAIALNPEKHTPSIEQFEYAMAQLLACGVYLPDAYRICV